MAKESSTPTKTDRVLQYLAKKPTASVYQIVEDLKPYHISEALAGKIKYSERREALKPKAKKPGRKLRTTAPSASSAGSTKADAIRAVAKSLPKPIRPRDVRAELAKQGIDASTTFIGKVLRAAGMKRKRRRKAAVGAAPAVAANSASLSVDDLVAAKKLIGQVGRASAHLGGFWQDGVSCAQGHFLL